jgi:peptidoglycan hydrolase CwlO-like protein
LHGTLIDGPSPSEDNAAQGTTTMNMRTTGIVVLAILSIAFVASTVHYANKASEAEARSKAREDASAKDASSMKKMTDDQQVFAAFVTGDPGTGTVASARSSLGIEEPKTVRTELDSLRAGSDRLTKENADLRKQANAAAAQLAEAKRAAADAAANATALRNANDEQGRQISQLRKELEAARTSAARASAAAPAVAPAAAPAAQAAAATPAPTAKAAAPSGPSAYWNGKEWPSDDELRHMMWKYYDTNKVDLEQPLAYKEAEKELRRRTGAK